MADQKSNLQNETTQFNTLKTPKWLINTVAWIVFIFPLIYLLLVASGVIGYDTLSTPVFLAFFLVLVLAIIASKVWLLKWSMAFLPVYVFILITLFALSGSEKINPSPSMFNTLSRDDYVELDIWLAVGSFDGAIEGIAIVPTLVEYHLKTENSNEFDRICIEEFFVGERVGNDINLIHRSFELSQNTGQMCGSISEASFDRSGVHLYEVEMNQLNGLSLFTDRAGYFYPFDSHSVEIVVQTTYSLWLHDELIHHAITIPSLHLYETFDNWDLINISIENQVWSIADQERVNVVANLDDFEDTHRIQLGSYHQITLKLSRPILFKANITFIILFIAIIISFTTLLKDLGTYIETTLAVLFGLFGIREVIMPLVNGDARIFLDIVLIGLYVEIALASILFLLSRKYSDPPRDTSIADEPKYFASRSSQVFHAMTCRWFESIRPDNRVDFISISAARKSGRHQCKLCLKDQSED